jgi:hypothetical protein
MFLAKQNKVQMVFLPSHCSHILQPLDLGVFSSVKSKYRRLIDEHACLEDSAPVRKARFIQYYNIARTQGLSRSNIIAGFKATGIWPYNPAKGLNSSQLLKEPPLQLRQQSSDQQSTPIQESVLLQTPQSQRLIYIMISALQKEQALSRSCVLALKKAGKAIGRLSAQYAEQQAINKHQNLIIQEARHEKSRKRVQVDPNLQFANVEQIRRDKQVVTETQQAQQQQLRTEIPQHHAQTPWQESIQQFQFNFHVNNTV